MENDPVRNTLLICSLVLLGALAHGQDSGVIIGETFIPEGVYDLVERDNPDPCDQLPVPQECFPDGSYGLTPGSQLKKSFGKGHDNLVDYIVTQEAHFTFPAGQEEFAVQGWDIAGNEVFVYANGVEIGSLSKAPGTEMNKGDVFGIPADTNIITLRNRGPNWSWVVLNIYVGMAGTSPGFSDNPTEPDPPEPGDLPPVVLLETPYYDGPQYDIVERNCGPESEWDQYHVRSNEEQAALPRLGKAGIRAIVHFYGKEAPYIEPLSVKGAACIKVVGHDLAPYGKPVIAGINMLSNSNNGNMQGGLVVKNMRLSHYEAARADPEGDRHYGGDCLQPPSAHQFMWLEDVDILGCTHHSFITSKAESLYIHVLNSSTAYSGSHNVYIDRVAYLHWENSKSYSSSPDGHALRCIGQNCNVIDSHISNIELDGRIKYKVWNPTTGKVWDTTYDVPADGRGPYRGMAALEVYNCGGPHLTKNTRIDFFRRSSDRTSTHAMAFRARDAQWGCDKMYHDETRWYRGVYGTPEWVANTNWPDIEWHLENVTVNCLTDFESPIEAQECHAFANKSSHPIGHDVFRAEWQQWLKQNNWGEIPEGVQRMAAQFNAVARRSGRASNTEMDPVDIQWELMIDALPDAGFTYPYQWYEYVADQIWANKRLAHLQGKFLNKMPVEPHPQASHERAVIKIHGLSVTNGYKNTDGSPQFYAPHWKSSVYCWWGQNQENCDNGGVMPQSRVEIIH